MAVLLSVQEQLERVGWGRFQMIAMTAFVLFLVSDGMELVVTNIIWQDLPLATWGVQRNASGERGKLVSLAFSGFVLGAFISALVGDIIGRRPLIFLHGVIFVPCSLLSAASDSLPQLGASRFAVGVSMGLVLPCVNSLMAEFSPIAFRAKAVISIPGVAYRSRRCRTRLGCFWLPWIFTPCHSSVGTDCPGRCCVHDRVWEAASVR